ncbi:PEP-CTERM protein-sorting domain-containing protein [Sphingomonas laterariae]|uniref:PEP-CTERM protein-sorting domain-containing protein n=2 Tax=Edaphosphingomonas laterariae TaxID=861865 RepID=A0A239BRD8_9SPHN|nr:PEPxxWA-CTERM sorting domain-containing protein [Sphingomonas laterariae]SNS10587.1 PEP-CTERM protein-sorting domain-containing protein [Sphingomonas laterariae]
MGIGRVVQLALIGCTTIISASALAATANPKYSTMYVFGDSLVDAGNIRLTTGGTVPAESDGYYQGRFTNGYDYTDHLSIALYGAPTTASLAGGNNYAFGGARVVNHGDAIPDVQFQLGAYAAGHGGVADSDALYVLNFGGNDIFGLLAGNIGSYTPDDYIAAVVATYAGSVQALNDMGARNILITGIPNPTEPLAYMVDGLLQSALDGLALDAGTDLMRYSYLDAFARIVADPGSLGLGPMDFSTPCRAAVANGPGMDCSGYFSFDGTHPSAQVQAAIALDMDRQFALTASVPEPASWAMMIAGFGLVGGALRRRERAFAI